MAVVIFCYDFLFFFCNREVIPLQKILWSESHYWKKIKFKINFIDVRRKLKFIKNKDIKITHGIKKKYKNEIRNRVDWTCSFRYLEL